MDKDLIKKVKNTMERINKEQMKKFAFPLTAISVSAFYMMDNSRVVTEKEEVKKDIKHKKYYSLHKDEVSDWIPETNMKAIQEAYDEYRGLY